MSCEWRCSHVMHVTCASTAYKAWDMPCILVDPSHAVRNCSRHWSVRCRHLLDVILFTMLNKFGGWAYVYNGSLMYRMSNSKSWDTEANAHSLSFSLGMSCTQANDSLHDLASNWLSCSCIWSCITVRVHLCCLATGNSKRTNLCILSRNRQF